MAKYRPIKTQFWTDPYVQGLSVEEKLVFLYLLSNPLTRICGIYEISMRTMAFELSPLTEQTIESALNRFCADRKIVWVDDWINIVNYQKHQQNNPSVRQGVERELSEIPPSIRSELTDCTQTVHRLRQTVLPNLTKPNLTKPSVVVENFEKATPREIAAEFFSSEEKQAELVSVLVAKGHSLDFVSGELTKFCSYWTELSNNGKKQRYEGEKFFDVGKRFAFWLSRSKPVNSPTTQRFSITIDGVEKDVSEKEYNEYKKSFKLNN